MLYTYNNATNGTVTVYCNFRCTRNETSELSGHGACERYLPTFGSIIKIKFFNLHSPQQHQDTYFNYTNLAEEIWLPKQLNSLINFCDTKWKKQERRHQKTTNLKRLIFTLHTVSEFYLVTLSKSMIFSWNKR